MNLNGYTVNFHLLWHITKGCHFETLECAYPKKATHWVLKITISNVQKSWKIYTKILLKQMPSLPTPPLRSDLWPPTSAHSLRLSAQGARNKKFRLCLLRLPLVVCGRRFGRGLAWMGKQKMLPSIKYLLKVWRSAWIGARPKGNENIMLAFHYVFHRWLNNFGGSLIEALFVSSILAEPSLKNMFSLSDHTSCPDPI